MAETLQTGLLLMLIGLSTVFCVLGVVIATGKLLILLVNTLHPQAAHAGVEGGDVAPDDPSGSKIAAITGAVHAITGGKGQITHIERLKE